MNKDLQLNNRAVISITGEDKETFLQGLITNDVNKASKTNAIYSFMLSPQGRFLYDFFIILDGERLLLDCDFGKVDEIVQKFAFFKFRSKVDIKKEEDLVVLVSFDEEEFLEDNIVFVDPRDDKMGYRAFVGNADPRLREDGKVGVEDGGNEDKGEGGCGKNGEYNLRRIGLKIPDDSDMTFDKSFPLEFGFDDFAAVDYKKGCYVGQETTARMHYKGTIRKKVFLVDVDAREIEKGTAIESGEKKIGEMLSSILSQNKLLALALIKNLDNEGKEVSLEELKLIPKMVIIS
ncbi:MAG: folate-binding protein YgfZ [Myxococcota bacterium]|jgi:folate-binding protein YgfZ